MVYIMSAIKYDDFIKIIPPENYATSQCDLRQQYSEWCLTEYNINNKTYITVHMIFPNTDKRIFVDKTGENILYDEPTQYDNYVVKKIYWYCAE